MIDLERLHSAKDERGPEAPAEEARSRAVEEAGAEAAEQGAGGAGERGAGEARAGGDADPAPDPALGSGAAEARAGHESDASSALAARTRALIGVVSLCWFAFAIRHFWMSHRVLVMNLIPAVVCAGLYFGVRRRPSLARPAAHLTELVSIALIALIAMHTGGVRAPALWYLVTAPLFAGYVLGIRPAFVWAGVAIVAAAAVDLSRRYFPFPQEYLVPEGEVWQRVALLIAVALIFSVITTRVHVEQLAVAEQREAVIRNLAAGLTKKNEETLRARDVAIAASRAKGEFLAIMSHEIRTPLNAVLGLTGVLLDGQLAAEQREIVRTIRSSGDSLLLLLNDILDFSKIEAGRLQLERAPFDVVDCAEDALDLFGAVATEKGLDLSCRASPDVPGRVFGDSGRVRQILVNLVSNAIKFTLRGTVQIEIDAEPVSVADTDVDTRIHCSVRDTGIGIPEDHLADLFQPFSQVDASTTRRFGGTGLGLAICRTLAERMGGRVWAESTKSRGSTFHFTFLARAMAEIPTHDPAHLGDHAAIILCPKEGTRSAVTSQIAALGLQVAPCATPAEMKEALTSMRPDLVIADETVPAHEAREALARMHRPPAFVLLSTAGRDSDARRALRDRWGPEPWITAIPVRRAPLRDAVFHALGFDETPAPRSSGVPPLANELPLRILVAEDNPVNQRVALLLLERLGYRADVVGNGGEAVDAVRARPYDVVLMDVRMPEVDGMEATRRIRTELPADRQPRVIALTANAMTEDRKACEAVGMDDFMSKPITTKELERVLRAARPRTVPPAPPQDAADEGALGGPELQALFRLTEGSPDTLRQIIDDFLETSARLIETIERAAEQGDAKSLEHAAHSLKGSSGQMGAQLLMAESAAVERAAASGDLATARDRLPSLLRKHEGARSKLTELRETGAPPGSLA